MSDSVWPHRWQPTRLPRPWDSPGKNTRVGCHFFLQCMKVRSESEVAQSCPTPSDPMDCSPPGSSVHGIFQARVLEWVPFKLEQHKLLAGQRPDRVLSALCLQHPAQWVLGKDVLNRCWLNKCQIGISRRPSFFNKLEWLEVNLSYFYVMGV